jgi:hypothetical protein
MQELKVAGVFCAIVVAGFMLNRFASDTGEQWRKELEEEARRNYPQAPWQTPAPTVPPGFSPNGPAWNPQPKRPVPPPVSMPSQGKK